MPVAGPGLPASGTVTCTGTITNQNPGVVINGGAANDGYGDGTQNGLIINIQPGAVLTGLFPGPQNPPTFTTANGLAVGDNNTINLLAGSQVIGISANGATGIPRATATPSPSTAALA